MAPCLALPTRVLDRALAWPTLSGGHADADRVKALREVLIATGAGIYLATHIAGPLPAETLAAVHESDELELRIGRVGPDRDEDLAQREWEARAVVAAVLRAPSSRSCWPTARPRPRGASPSSR